MTIALKQSTAVNVPLGPFVDNVDGYTAETGLTISQADIRLSKNGGAFAQTNNTAGATHMENGYYSIPLDTTDTNTLGSLRVAVSKAGALPVWQDFMVMPANVWDSLFGADRLHVDVLEVSSDSAAADNLEADYDGTGYNKANSTIGTASALTTNNDKTGYRLSAAGVDDVLDETVESTYTLRQIVRIMAAALAGESAGSGTATITFTGLDETTTRIEATVSSGNRTNVTLNGA